jgi:hypothetical protein
MFRRRLLFGLLGALFVPTESFLVVAARPSILTPIRRTGGSLRKGIGHTVQRSKNDSNEENFDVVRKSLNRDFVSVACPAFVQQVAVPFADLVDSTFLSKLAPEALGGVGVARSSQAAVSKLYTSALSKTSISFIASKYGASRSDETEESKGD